MTTEVLVLVGIGSTLAVGIVCYHVGWRVGHNTGYDTATEERRQHIDSAVVLMRRRRDG